MYCGVRLQILVLSRCSTVFVCVHDPTPGLTSKLQVYIYQIPSFPPIRAGNFISNIQPHILAIILDFLGQVNYKNSATDFKKKQLLVIFGVMYHHILNWNGSVIYYFTNISTFGK
jgi:hypothetical protein